MRSDLVWESCSEHGQKKGVEWQKKICIFVWRVSAETEWIKDAQEQKHKRAWDNDLLVGTSPLEQNPVYVMAAAEVWKGPSVSPPIICILNRDVQQGAK